MARSPSAARLQSKPGQDNRKVAAELTGAGSAAKRRTKALDKTRPRARLLIKHPSIDPLTITRLLGFEPSHACKAGEPRKLPNGAPLPGNYRETSWSLSFPNAENDTVGGLLDKLIPSLPIDSKLWSVLGGGGGQAWLIIAIVGTKYQGEEMSPDLMGRLAKMNIGLGLEIYAVPQN